MPTPEKASALPAKYDKDNKTVKHLFVNNMTNNLFDPFEEQRFAKSIWDSLVKQYGKDDAGRKKCLVGKWMQFQMVDDSPIMEQVQEYENLVADILNEGMHICEVLQASVLLEKFPPSWNDFRNHLKHEKRDFTLHDLIGRMQTEEANRLKDKQLLLVINNYSVNLVESSGSGKDRFKKTKIVQQGSQQKKYLAPKVADNKIQKKLISCYCCGKQGHKAYMCSQRKDKKPEQAKPPNQRPAQAIVAETEDVIVDVVVETNLVEKKDEWVPDTDATRRFCTNRELFHSFTEATDASCVFMGNSSMAGVVEKEKILLKLTSGKTLALNDVLLFLLCVEI